MATEIVSIPLQKTESLEDAGLPSFAAQVWNNSINILAQQDGFQRLYWGLTVEDRNVLRLFVDWDNVDSHKGFLASEQYKPFLEGLQTIMDGAPSLYHANLHPHPAVCALAGPPATEILTYYFPTTYSSSDRQAFQDTLDKFMAVIKEHAGDSYKGHAGGWAVEELMIPGTEAEKAIAYIVVIGWSSVAAHSAYRDTSHFKDSIGLLRGVKDVKKSSLVHACLRQFPA